MELNQKLVDKLAGLLKIDASNLAEGLKDVNVEIELPSEVLTQEQVETLVNNIQKEKYESGKTAGKEMTLKALKQKYSEDYGIELDGIKDYDEFINKLIDFKTEKINLDYQALKEESGKEVNSQIEAFKLKLEKSATEKEAFQNHIKDLEVKFENEMLNQKKKFDRQRGDTELVKHFTRFNYKVPKEVQNLGEESIEKYLQTKRLNDLALFKTKVDIDFDEEDKIYLKDKSSGEILKTKLHEYVSLEDRITSFAKENYLNIEQEEQIAGRGSAKKKGVKIQFDGMTKEAFDNYCSKNNISPNTNEMDAAYSEWMKANK
jgi:hypothetical protein